MNTPMMKCGHSANGTISGTDKPVCVICSEETVVETPSFLNRKAKCRYQGCKTPLADSSTKLAFFESRPKETHDQYYCGCYGWE